MRMHSRQIAAAAVVLSLVAATVWALSTSKWERAEFTFCNGDEIKTIDPAIVTGAPEGRIIRALFEGLTMPHPETLEPQPSAAESWDISDDGLVYTFTLRRGAVWSDGTPVTSHDFAFSFQRLLHPGTAAEYAYEMWYVEGAEEYTRMRVAAGDAVEIELPHEVETSQPWPRAEVLRGTLKSIDDAPFLADAAENGEPAKIYNVEIDGRQRRFERSGLHGEEYQWLLPDFEKTVAIETIDDGTLRMKLQHPVPYFLTLMGFYPMFPVQRECLERFGSPLWTKPENLVTNGPYRMESRRIRDRIRLVKSDTYWNRDNVHIRTIDALAVKSETTMLNLYLTGEVDYILQVPTPVAPDLMRRSQNDFKPQPYMATYYYRLNVNRPPFDDVRVRKALGLAIDKAEIVERVTRSGQRPATSFVPDVMSDDVDYTPGRCGEYDPEEARRLLAEAGFPEGRGLPPVEILFNDVEAHQAIAELVQAQWQRNLGVNVQLAKMEWSAYQSRTRARDYMVSRAAWIADYSDPNTFLDMFVTDGENNQTGWGNPEYDRLVREAREQADVAQRMRMFHDAEQILMDEMPIVPVYYYVTTAMVRPYVKGFYFNSQDVHPYQGMSIDHEEKRRVLEER